MGWTNPFFTIVVIQGPNAGLFIYSPAPGLGTLIGSWSAIAGTDKFGNSFPAGINANSGVLNGVSINNSSITAAQIFNAFLSSPQITNPTISQGNIVETVITFDSGGGGLFGYTTTTTTVIQNVAGGYSITFPTGVTSAKVECWGAGPGAGGGNSSLGGETGGGGEYAQEPAYPVIAGTPYTYVVGSGGSGGATGSPGQDGGDSFFDVVPGQVFAQGGHAGINFLAGTGGNNSINTIHFPGGNGANAGTSTGGSSGGNSGNPTAAGNNGIRATSSTGATSPAAQAGSGTGGAGGNNAANGSNGGSPGAAGGGAGAGTAVTNFSKQYRLNGSNTYFGSDANAGAPPNGIHNAGTMFQGGETASGGSFNGVMKSMGLWPSSQIQSDLAGATITGVTLRLENLHSWFNSGMTIALGYTNNSSLPGSYNGASTSIGTYSIAEGQTKTFTLPNSYGTALQNGSAKTIVIGPGPGNISNPNLAYYGFFYGSGGDNNQNPLLTVNGHTGAGATNAGNGSDGQVKITYQSTNVLAVAVSPVAGTDQFGNAFPEGFLGPVLTLVNLAIPPVAPASGVNLSADSVGSALHVVTQTGFHGNYAPAVTDSVSRTANSTSFANVTPANSIPANDPQVGTLYRIMCGGFGTQGSTQQALSFQILLGSTAMGGTTMSATTIPASTGFHWNFTGNIIVVNTGSVATVRCWGVFEFSVAAAGGTSGTAAFDSTNTFDTTAANNVQVQMKWGSATGSPTITSNGSSLERLGA